jgi:exopolyphosphatase/guanosine-5'-triphosphate,3'-diphosphate pyrophosphatase
MAQITKRLAGLDLGTNTFLLLIADVGPHDITPVFEKETVVRLGKGVDAGGNLSPESMQRGVLCLQEYIAFANQYHCQEIFAVGTSALRDAANRESFLARVKTETGLKVRIISGEDEARLSFLGALSNKNDLPEPLAIIDIGGGSTEVVRGTHKGILEARSTDLGSVRLTERWLKHDPVLPEEVKVLREQAEKTMRAAWPVEEIRRTATMIGTAGTITTIAAMVQKLTLYDPKRIDGFVMTARQLNAIIAELARLSIAERQMLPGLNPARADVILAGALLLEVFMSVYGFSQLLVSDRGLRYGVLWEAAGRVL